MFSFSFNLCWSIVKHNLFRFYCQWFLYICMMDATIHINAINFLSILVWAIVLKPFATVKSSKTYFSGSGNMVLVVQCTSCGFQMNNLASTLRMRRPPTWWLFPARRDLWKRVAFGEQPSSRGYFSQGVPSILHLNRFH